MEPKIGSMNKEIKRSEIEIEVMESTAFSPEKEEGEGSQTLEKSDAEKEVEVEVEERVAKKRGLLMGTTIKEKWVSIKRDFQDQLRRHGCDRKLEMETIRAYQVWPGKNVFFFHGRLICGPDPRGSMLTSLSIVLSSWIFGTYVAQDLANHSAFLVTFSLILTFIVLLNLVLLSAIDPGIIPRNDEEYSESEEIGAGDGTRRNKKVIINGVEVKLKYCRVCKIFRPPRSCHCAICDNCVERFDHHCPWIGQCVAMRNYRFYLTFVILALIFFAYIFSFSCVRMHQRMSNNGAGFIGLVKTCPETLALAAFSSTAIGFLGALVIYHVYLITINETAYENFRQRYVGNKNPFDKGILGNLKEAFFVALPPSRVDFRAGIIAATP